MPDYLTEFEMADTPILDELVNGGEQPTKTDEASAEPGLTVDEKLDFIAGRVNELHLRIDDLLNGVSATYTGVQWLTNMLAGVQKVAAMMPGRGGKIAKQMMAAQAENEATDNG